MDILDFQVTRRGGGGICTSDVTRTDTYDAFQDLSMSKWWKQHYLPTLSNKENNMKKTAKNMHLPTQPCSNTSITKAGLSYWCYHGFQTREEILSIQWHTKKTAPKEFKVCEFKLKITQHSKQYRSRVILKYTLPFCLTQLWWNQLCSIS